MLGTRGALAGAIALSAFAAVAPAPVSGSSSPGAPSARPAQELAVLLTAHEAFPTYSARPGQGRALPAWAPITGGQTVVPVVGQHTTAGGVRWLRVMLPGRPNSSTGWIKQRGTRPTSTSWRITIKTATRRVRVYRKGVLARSFSAVVGKPATPTPYGRFFVEESIRMPVGHPGAPYALALSARSNVLQEFAGGPGQIAVHGVANLGGTPGTAVSHGCIRLANHHIRWLAARVGPGVPVTITR